MPADQPPRLPTIPPRPPKSTAQVLAECAVDIVAIVFVGVLALKRVISGDWSLLMIAVLAGVRVTDLVAVRGGTGGPPSGGGSALLALLAWGGMAARHLIDRSGHHLVVVGVAVSASLWGCPRLPDPDGCTPRATRCQDGVPEVCSPSQRWTPVDRPCGEVSAMCCATPSAYGGRELHACVPADRCLDQEAGR